ncbi:MAG: YceI family protein [Polyangiales bacterium]
MKKSLLAVATLAALALAAPLGLAQNAPRPAAQPAAAPTGVQRFELRPSGISRVAFTSDAPLETIDGVSTNTTGTLTVDLANPGRGLQGSVQITTASLRTGNDMRDEHLRGGNWLDAEHHPNVTFQLVSTTLNTPLAAGRPARGRVTGRLTLHGVTRDVTVPVTVRLVPLAAEHAEMAQFGVNADMLRVQTEFNVNLSDYNVSIFAPLRLKVSNTIRLRVDLTAFRQAQ